jgi:hypothetical protein
MAGCTLPRGQATHLPDLHLPHVKQVPGFEEFYQRYARIGTEHLDDFVAYQPDGPGTTGRVLVSAALPDDNSALLDMGLDGSGGRKVADGGLCWDRPAVTRDSHWLLCLSYNGQLMAQSLTDPPPYQGHLLALVASHLRLPAWGPDGKRFVAVERVDAECRLSIYRTAPLYTEARAIAQIRVPQAPLFPSAACDYYDLGWSPDGRWLAMMVLTAQSEDKIYTLDLSKLPLPADNAGAPPVELTTSTDVIEDLGGQGGAGRRLTLPNAPHVVTITYSGEVVNVDILTHERFIALQQDVGQICGVSWTPDGTQLAFSLCRPGNNDVAGARPQLYVYTP